MEQEEQTIIQAQERLLAARERILTTSPKSSAIDPPPVCDSCGKSRSYLQFGDYVSTLLLPCMCPESVALRTASELDEAKKEEERSQQERERKTMSLVKKVFRDSMVPERFLQRTFQTYDRKRNPQAFDIASKYAADFTRETKAGLMFFGTPGTGKTHLSAAIANAQLIQGRSVIFGTVPGLLSRLRESYDKGTGEKEAEIMQAFFSCALLVMDDLGKEKVSDWVEEKVYEIINTRYEQEKPVIITTNVGLGSVESRYGWNGAAIVSRLFEMCQGVKMDGEDYRRGV